METVRFIAQDPNVSRYSRRIPQSEWEQHKDFLGQLHEQGITREQMVRDLCDQRNFHVTKNRLDNHMKEWGFARYKRESQLLPALTKQSTLRTSATEEISLEEIEVTRPASRHEQSENKFRRSGPVERTPALSDPLSSMAQDWDDDWVDELHDEFYQLLNPSIERAEECSKSQSLAFGDAASISMHTVRLEKEPSGILNLQNYSCGPEALMLYQNIRMRLRSANAVTSTQGIRRLNRVGILLYALKAYRLAFDIFFLILQYQYDLNSSIELPSRELVIAIINCARCAQTSSQRSVALTAIAAVLTRLERSPWMKPEAVRKGEVNVPAPIVDYLRVLQDVLSCENPSARSQDAHETTFPAIVSLIIEKNSCSSDCMCEVADANTDGKPDHWENSILEHLTECSITRSSILDAVKAFKRFIMDSDLADAAIQKFSHVEDNTIARILSYLLLQEDAGRSVATSDPTDTGSSHFGGFPCALNGLVLTSLPSILMQLIQERLSDPLMPRIIQQENQGHRKHLLLTAAMELESLLTWNPEGHAKFLRLYLESTVCNEVHKTLNLEVPPSSWVFTLAAAAAGLADFPGTFPGASWLDNLQNASSKIVDTATSAEAPTCESGPITDLRNLEFPSPNPNHPVSDRSSLSTDFESFRELSKRAQSLRPTSVQSKQTKSSDAMSLSSTNSWNFNRVTGFANLSSLSSVRGSMMSSLDGRDSLMV